MIAFTENELKKIRERARNNPKFIEKIEADTKDVRDKVYIQKTALATWEQFYLCPKHTVQLKLNYYDSKHHVCPIDGEVFTGEPYDGSWWCRVADMNFAACYKLAVAYIATEDDKYLERVHDILLGYAAYYPSYEVHGNIPYNKPAKAYAQVLNDSFFLNSLARAYDLTKDTFTLDEQKLIEKNLLLEGAAFLKENGTPQIHNHEVATCSAIGIIGLILEREDLLEYALDEKYGLKYQLDHAVLADGMWFEVTAGYHLYALHWFMSFEKFARHTKYSLFADPHYRDILHTMLIYPNRLWKSNGTFTKLNDNSGTLRGQLSCYEYGYSYFKDDEILWALYQALYGKERTEVESLLYGENVLPEDPKHEYKNYYNEDGTHFAIINGSDDRYLFFKASPYGGEHDHYDRLAVSFSAYGCDMSADLGTASGYGAPLHYAYFKNTATHNTVVINGDNMPPAETRVNLYKEYAPDNIYLDAETKWSSDCKMPDMHVIKQWVDESYDGVGMRRIIRWYDRFFIDVFEVCSDNELSKDWTFHIDGNLKTLPVGAKEEDAISSKNPQKIFHDIKSLKKADGVIKSEYDCGEFDIDIYSLSHNRELIYALGPNNPSTSDISYIIERSYDKKVVFVNVIEAHRRGEAVINSVDINLENDEITVHKTDGNKIKFSPGLKL